MREAAVVRTFGCLLFLFSLRDCLDITKDGAGYRGLVVAIHRDVPEDPKLIQNIKTLIGKSSLYLFKATDGRAYFQEVTIVVPSTWSQKLTSGSVHRDFYEQAHVRVAEPNPDYGDAPYTLQPGECGDPGLFIHLTPKFLVELDGWTKEMFGEPERQLIHEWAHFRYGVFDEYGTPGDARYPMFYQYDGKILPTSCVRDVSGWIERENGDPCIIHPGGLVGPDCIFIPDMSGALGTGIRASIMYMPFLPEMEGFCNDGDVPSRAHNWRAPSRQNSICKHQSTWTVIKKNADFVDQNWIQVPNDTNIIPNFQVVRKDNHQRTVLVLDNSGSMRGRPLRLLHEAASRFIMDTVPQNSSLGVVKFSSSARVQANLTVVNSKLTRMSLVNKVPKSVEGATAIGDALLKALQVLTRFGTQSAKGAMILLITDGDESEHPKISEVLPELVSSGASVNCIAFGRKATDKLEELSKKTGGKAFLFPNVNGPVSALDSAFYDTITVQSDVELQPVTLQDNAIILKKGVVTEVAVTVDKEVGLQTLFTFRGVTVNQVDVQLLDPDRTIFNSESQEFFEDSALRAYKMYTFHKAKPGTWTVRLNSTELDNSQVSWTVTSSVNDARDQPVRVRSWFGQVELRFPAHAKIFAQVTKGQRAVINATAQASVQRPNAPALTVELRDNGAGADAAKDDGIYTSYFRGFTGPGRYSAMVTVLNNGQARLRKSSGDLWSRAPIRPRLSKEFRTKRATATSFDLDSFSSSPDPVPEVRIESDPAQDFIRNANPGSFSLTGYHQNETVSVQPNRITDLVVVDTWTEEERVWIRVRLTAPGDDMDSGTAFMYDFRYSLNDSDQLIRDFEGANTFSTVPVPDHSGINQLLELSLLTSDSRHIGCFCSVCDVFLAAKAVSSQGGVAELSNIASAHFGYDAPFVTDSSSNRLSCVLTIVLAIILCSKIG